jgi:hypothetical protein
MIMNHWVAKNQGISPRAEQLLASQGLFSMELADFYFTNFRKVFTLTTHVTKRPRFLENPKANK